MDTDEVLCPVHEQKIKIEQDKEHPEISFAICTCKVVGQNKYAGVRVWERRGVPNKVTYERKPLIIKKESQQ